MGQTLSHGVYLPNEGERNCYAGLASNWQILNTAVGNIAEKAPLVHTHTVSQITDFPAYGTTAGTICEGNDSRLSDARTPLAHTHTKSDVTDLFNSANTWTGSNVYSSDSLPVLKLKNTSLDISSLPASNLGIQIGYLDKNNVVVGGWNYIKGPDGTTRLCCELATKNSNNQEIRRTLRLDTDQNGVNWQFYPSSADINLGTSTNQWKSIYAQTYYYNGTQWGLDQANEWTGSNTYTGIVLLNSSSDVAEQFKQKLPKDVSTSNDAMARVNALVDLAGHYVVVETLGHWANYVAKNTTLKYKNDSTKQGAIEFRLYSDGSGIFYAQAPFECDLGNSYNKWKTLNGINPGALSLPGTGGFTDIKGDITNLSGGDNTFTAPYDGWVCVKSANATIIHIINTIWAVSQSATQSTAGTLCCLCPVMSGQSFSVIVNATSLEYAYIHPCKGNV